MPILLDAIAVDFNELLKDCRCAALAFLSESRRVVKVAVYVSIVFVITLLGFECLGAYRALEVFQVVFPTQSCNVRAAERSSTSMAKQIQ